MSEPNKKVTDYNITPAKKAATFVEWIRSNAESLSMQSELLSVTSPGLDEYYSTLDSISKLSHVITTHVRSLRDIDEMVEQMGPLDDDF